MVDIALLILRLVLGLTMAGHGAQKIFGWFGGPGMEKHSRWLESLNLRPGWLWGWLSALAEFAGGLLLALGLFTPVAAAAIIGAMVMAIAKVHGQHGFWNTKRGYEYNLLIAAAAFAIGVAGPGAFALGPALFALPQLQLFAASLLASLAGVALGILASEASGRRTQTR